MRKTLYPKSFTFCCNERLAKDIEAVADRTERHISTMIREIVAEYVEEQIQEQSPKTDQ